VSESRTVVALLPMRAQSERVIDKNIRPFAGRPLYEVVLETLSQCPSVERVYINTDSPVIASDAPKRFARVQIIDRPEALRAGTVPMNDVLRYDAERIDSRYFLQTHSTNPLLRPETVERAIGAFFDGLERNSCDSLFSVTPLQTRLYDADFRPLNHDPSVLLRTQDLPPVYEENSNLYLFSRDQILERGNRIGERPLLFPIERDEAWDIDEPIDFAIAEFLYEKARSE